MLTSHNHTDRQGPYAKIGHNHKTFDMAEIEKYGNQITCC